MKYEIILTSAFKKELKNIKKRNNDLSKLTEIVNKLANDIELDIKNRDHQLVNNLRFQNCRNVILNQIGFWFIKKIIIIKFCF